MKYTWASNEIKLKRALAVYPDNEQKCKELYIALGGLVLGESSAITEFPDLTKAPSTNAPEALKQPITQENKKVDVSPFQCKECEFVGKNDRSLALHFRKKHAK